MMNSIIDVIVNHKNGNCGPTNITIDSELNDTSENAVQNKAVAKAVKGGNSLSGSTSYTVTDSVEYPIVGLKVFGKSTQDGTPTPENPVDIVSIVEPTVKVCGKNLLNAKIQSFSQNGITISGNDDGTYILNGTATTDFWGLTKFVFDKGNYKLVGCPTGGGRATYELGVWNESGDIYYGKDHGNGIEFVIDKKQTVSLYLGIRMGITCNNLIFKPMITTDLTATYDDFEPYTANTLTIPDTLNAIPVSSGGNVTIDGQEYIADYVDFERGVKVQRTEKVVLSSLSYNISESGFYYITPAIENIKVPKANNIVANIVAEEYIPMPWDEILSTDNGVAASTSGQVIFANNKAGNPTGTMIYALATPIETPLAESELQAYRQLQTYNGTTNISNDKGAGLSVEYCTNKALSDCVVPIITGLQKQIGKNSGGIELVDSVPENPKENTLYRYKDNVIGDLLLMSVDGQFKYIPLSTYP